MGEIKRFLRDDGMVKVSRSLKEIHYKVKKEKELYQKEYHREPTLQEISVTLQIDEADILMAMESGQEISSLHQVIYQSDGDEIHLEDKIEKQTDEIEEAVNRMYISQLLSHLNEQEKKLIEMRYFEIRHRRRWRRFSASPRYRCPVWKRRYWKSSATYDRCAHRKIRLFVIMYNFGYPAHTFSVLKIRQREQEGKLESELPNLPLLMQ